MLRRNGSRPAISGRFDKQTRAWSDLRKQPFAFAKVAVGIAPNLTLDQRNEDWSRIDRSGVTTAMAPSEAQGPLQSNGMCLDELTVHSKLNPKASTEHTVDLPQVTS